MGKYTLQAYDSKYRGLATMHSGEEHNLVLCEVVKRSGMLWWKKVEKADVWGITGLQEEWSYPSDIDRYWIIMKTFAYGDKDLAEQFFNRLEWRS